MTFDHGVAAIPIPVTVDLGGGIGPSWNKQYLIGQKATPLLSSGGLVQSAWNWTVSGGEQFKDWIASLDNAILIGLVDLTTPTLDFHFAVPDGAGANVSCFAHLAVPPGALRIGIAYWRSPSQLSGMFTLRRTPASIRGPEAYHYRVIPPMG